MIAEKAGDSTETRYIRGLGLVATKGSAGTMAYYLHNAHGDVTNLVDSMGGVKNSYSYDAFGNALTCTETVSNRFMYAGEQFDKVTGEYYLRARYYEPVVGRFIQEDTYKGDGLNLYAYVANNPVNLIDPSGHCKTGTGIETIQDEQVPGGKPSPNILSVSGSFLQGIGDAAVANLQGIWGIITHPVETAKNAWFLYMASKPGTAQNAEMNFVMGLVLEKTWNDFSEGDANKKARMIGRAVGEILMLVAADKGTGAAIDLLKTSAQSGKLAELLSKIGRSKSVASDAAKVVEEAAKTVGNSTDITNLLDKMPELTGSTRDKLLSVIQNSKLRNIVDQLYRPGATVGDGGTASILKREFSQGSSTHLVKAQERLTQLNNLAKSEKLSLNDSDILDALRNDLNDAINLFK